jgi:hypothetical protein
MINPVGEIVESDWTFRKYSVSVYRIAHFFGDHRHLSPEFTSKIIRHNHVLTPTKNEKNRPGLHVNPALFDFISPALFEQQSYADIAIDDRLPTSVFAGLRGIF